MSSLPDILDKLIAVVPLEFEHTQSISLLVLLHVGALFGFLVSDIHDGTKKLRIPPNSAGLKLTNIGNSCFTVLISVPEFDPLQNNSTVCACELKQ